MVSVKIDVSGLIFRSVLMVSHRKINPKRQVGPVCVCSWESDADFAVFPQGARAKEALISPDQVEVSVLTPGKRYLFKRSMTFNGTLRYPDQFWSEVVAYRVGCLIGVLVPPAFAAHNSSTGVCASLIEWFYEDGQEQFGHGGDFLPIVNQRFDRKRGEQHNLKDNGVLIRFLSRRNEISGDWRVWWVDALLFDALIGNTDRHQDNWGLLFNQSGFRISPLFDNGTSLGYELLPEKVKEWSDQKFDKYISRGTHHVKWSLDEDPPIRGHLDLLDRAFVAWPHTLDIIRARIDVSDGELFSSFSDLINMDLPISLTEARADCMFQLLRRRLERIKRMINERD